MFLQPVQLRQYQSASRKPFTKLQLNSPISQLDLNPVESRAFEFYLYRVAPCLAGTLDSPFWLDLVPKICHANEGARNAVLAISALFENPPGSVCPDPDRHRVLPQHYQALKWQLQSIAGFHRSLGQSRDVVQLEIALLSCVLLTSIEYAQNNVHNAVMLLDRGFEVAGSISTGRNYADGESLSTIKNVLLPMLARQTVLMASFGHMPPQSWFERFQEIAPTSITSMTSMSDVRAGLYTCLWKSMDFIHSVVVEFTSGADLKAEDPASLIRSQQKLVLQELMRWYSYFRLFRLDRTDDFGSKERQAIAAMLMYYHVAHVWTTTCLDITHMQLDKNVDHFEAIVRYAESIIEDSERAETTGPSPTFSFEMRVIPPLFFTGLRCRHPLLRRKCINLLRRAPKQEALFEAERNARAIEKVIGLEETTEFREAVSDGTWDGVLMPSQDMRCQHVVVHYEDAEGNKAAPSLIYTRGIQRMPSGELLMNTKTLPLF